MFVSVTRLRLRGWWFFPLFFLDANRSVSQAAKSAGFVSGQTLLDKKLTFWTLTLWESDGAMRAYRGSGVHGKAMPNLARWCSEAQTAHYTTESAALPAWGEAHAQLVAHGRSSKVNHPSGTESMAAIPVPASDAWRVRRIA